MAWVEVYGGQRSLAFELTTATMDDYASSQVMWESHITIVTFESYTQLVRIFLYSFLNLWQLSVFILVGISSQVLVMANLNVCLL